LPKAQNKQVIMLMTESPKQAAHGHCQKSPKQAVHHAHGREPKTSRAHGHCQKPETSSFIILMADKSRTSSSSHLISSGNGSWPLMAGLNKIMKDDEII
jgi:hypothetical protein